MPDITTAIAAVTAIYPVQIRVEQVGSIVTARVVSGRGGYREKRWPEPVFSLVTTDDLINGLTKMAADVAGLRAPSATIVPTPDDRESDRVSTAIMVLGLPNLAPELHAAATAVLLKHLS